jgi:amino acid adenylation domain-containing protein
MSAMNSSNKKISETAVRQKALSAVAELSEHERYRLLVEWNDTRVNYPAGDCGIHHLFEAQSARTPDATALIFDKVALSYGELNGRANQIAHYLVALGVGPETLVGVCFDRSAEMIIAILGVLKAGGAYVPLDPAFPHERLAFMLEDSKAAVLLTERGHSAGFKQNRTTRVVCLDDDWERIAREPATNPALESRAENLAYVIYTSGSTGVPKGVAIQHDSLINYTRFILQLLQIDEPLQFATVSTIAADLGNTCVFPSLVSGGCLHIIDYATSMSAARFREYTAKHPIDVLKIVPSHLSALLASPADGGLLPLKYLILGGEALSWELIRRISLTKPACRIINHYGPTEATVGSLTSVVDTGQSSAALTVPIGRPIANAQVYILDQNLQPVPVGVAGELYLGGAGLARGYLGRRELTKERFIPNPFSPEQSPLLYKTGDLARYDQTGNVEYLGRIDNQVKINGHRIELGEIESAISSYPAVKENVVTAKEVQPGNRRLVAYIVPDRRRPVKTDDLSRYLKQKLPHYMVPSLFIELDALPLTLNGKIDHKALPAPITTVHESFTDFTSPRDTVEAQLVKIWESLLNVRQIGVRDNFFELGGHSLQAVRMFAEIEKTFGKNVPLATLFAAGTIEELAIILRQDGWAAPESSLVPIQHEGEKAPFFCIHAKGGNVLFYRDLARHMGTDRPFYGLQARRLGGRQVGHGSVEEMAEFYIKEILTVQPEGPYYLGGSSFGGLAAFEIARQLHNRGEKVALLALLDTGTPGYPKLLPGTTQLRSKIYEYVRRIQHHRQSLKVFNTKEKAEYVFSKLKKVKLQFRRKVNNTYKSSVRKFYRELKPHGSLPENYIQIEDQIARAGQKYVPKIYPGKLTLFRASNQPLGIYPDPTLGWDGLAAGGLEIHEVPGHHGSIVAEPNVRVLAEKLNECIGAAELENEQFDRAAAAYLTA